MNVHPGCLAIVVGCVDARFNGATCEVIGDPPKPLPSDLVFESKYWHVRFARPMPWTHGSAGFDGSFPDMWLRKIAGPDVAERVLQENLREWRATLQGA